MRNFQLPPTDNWIRGEFADGYIMALVDVLTVNGLNDEAAALHKAHFSKPCYQTEVQIFTKLHKQIWDLEGALDSQDERMRKAGKACGILFEEHGCDWPDAVAERLVHLRTRHAD